MWRPRRWWRQAVPTWGRWATRAVKRLPRWWRRAARRAAPTRWPHRWNTATAAATAAGVGLTQPGPLLRTRWINPTRWVSARTVPLRISPVVKFALEDRVGVPQRESDIPPRWVYPGSGRALKVLPPRGGIPGPDWGTTGSRWQAYKVDQQRSRLGWLVHRAKLIHTVFDWQRVGRRAWVQRERADRGGRPDNRPVHGGWAQHHRLRRRMFRYLLRRIAPVGVTPWGATRRVGLRGWVDTTVENFQQFSVPTVPRPKPEVPLDPVDWPRRRRLRPWLPWVIYRKVMNPPPAWKVYAAANLHRRVTRRVVPSWNVRRPRRWWLPKPAYKWNRKIRRRVRYLVMRQEHPLGRRRYATIWYHWLHRFTLRVRRVSRVFRRVHRRRRMYLSPRGPRRWRHHWPPITVGQFIYRRGRGPRRRRPRRGYRRPWRSAFERRQGWSPRDGQYYRHHRGRSPTVWAARLWGLLIRGGRKARVEILARNLRRGGFHPWEVYAGGWSHLGSRLHRRGGSALAVPTLVGPTKAAAVARRWVTRVIHGQTHRDWSARVATALTDSTGVAKLRDTHHRGNLVNVALL